MDFKNHPRFLNSMVDLDTPLSQRRLNRKCPYANNCALNNMKFRKHKNIYIYDFNVAGIPKEALKLTVEKDRRLISLLGKVDEKNDEKNNIYESRREINMVVRIPMDGDIKTIKTMLKNGILTITMKKITINGEQIKIN